MSAIKHSSQVSYELRVHFTQNVFEPGNLVLRNTLVDAASSRIYKALVILDESLAQAQPALAAQIGTYFEIHSEIDRYHIDRHSYVIAIGGGALLDMAGLAAATAHRGVRHVRIPTTTLSQADSGIGVKNGINAFGKKNFIGTFAPPFAVVNDFQLLNSLSARDKRAGYVEAVKVALIRDREFFEVIEADARALSAFEPAAMQRLIYRCAQLHLNHIATSGDPFEFGSARPLDFGHW